MTTLILLILLVAITSAAFTWLASSFLEALSWPMVQLGSALHKTAKATDHADADIWLFVLLLRITRPIVLGLATILFAVSVTMALFSVSELVHQLQNALINFFSIFLLMRLLCLACGAAVLGGSVRSVLKTLKG